MGGRIVLKILSDLPVFLYLIVLASPLKVLILLLNERVNYNSIITNFDIKLE